MACTVSLMCSRRTGWRASTRQSFRCAMLCSTRIRREECAFALALVHLLVPARGVLIELAVRWCHYAPAGVGSQALVAGTREDLGCRTAVQEPDQPQLAGIGDVRAVAVLGRAAEEHPAVAIRDDHGFHRVLLALAGDELVPVFAFGSRASDSNFDAVDDAGLPAGAEMVDDLGEGPQPHSPADSAASPGQKRPHLTDDPGDGRTADAEPAGRHVVHDGVTQMHGHGQETVNEHQLVFRTGTPARFRGRDASETRSPSHDHDQRSRTRRLTAYRARTRQVLHRGRTAVWSSGGLSEAVGWEASERGRRREQTARNRWPWQRSDRVHMGRRGNAAGRCPTAGGARRPLVYGPSPHGLRSVPSVLGTSGRAYRAG